MVERKISKLFCIANGMPGCNCGWNTNKKNRKKVKVALDLSELVLVRIEGKKTFHRFDTRNRVFLNKPNRIKEKKQVSTSRHR